ncbi:hypothetical protein C8R45DRAFT_1221804 [Mycena sanguinolenta]|nr:hypothetical protein C8R45DRAFT_1221804 [Mycena sanguinolenta]
MLKQSPRPRRSASELAFSNARQGALWIARRARTPLEVTYHLHEEQRDEDDDQMLTAREYSGHDDEHEEQQCQPTLPVVVAFTSPHGNWLTCGDHFKDYLLLLLLVYGICIIPWSPTTPSARASRAPVPCAHRTHPLLALCIAAQCSSVPWLCLQATTGSTTLFALVTAIFPMRELAARISSPMSMLHTIVHGHISPSQSQNQSQATELAGVAVRGGGSRASAETTRCTRTSIERGVRRVERRVGKLRAREKKDKVALASTSTLKTVFVHVAAPAPKVTLPSPSLFTGQLFFPFAYPLPASPPSLVAPSIVSAGAGV